MQYLSMCFLVIVLCSHPRRLQQRAENLLKAVVIDPLSRLLKVLQHLEQGTL